jgi:hypothetical protein
MSAFERSADIVMLSVSAIYMSTRPVTAAARAWTHNPITPKEAVSLALGSGHGQFTRHVREVPKTKVAVPSTMTARLRPRLTASALLGAPFSGGDRAGTKPNGFEL